MSGRGDRLRGRAHPAREHEAEPELPATLYVLWHIFAFACAALLALAVLALLVGCTPKQGEAIVKYAEAGGRYLTLTEPIIRGAYDWEQEECGKLPTADEDARCVEAVRVRWAPILEAIGATHEAYCGIDPEAATCKP